MVERRRSDVWLYFASSDDDEVATCKSCDERISYKCTTSNLRRHLERKHGSTYKRETPIRVRSMNKTRLRQERNTQQPIKEEPMEPNTVPDESNSSSSIQPPPKTRKSTDDALKSDVWMYFTKCDDDETNAVCNICKEPKSFRSSITNLKRHLRLKHAIEADYAASTSSLDTCAALLKYPSNSLLPAKRRRSCGPRVADTISTDQKELIDRDLLNLFIKDFQSLSIVEDEGFMKLMRWIPGYDLPEKKTISDVMLPDLYSELFESTKDMVLQEAETVCITTDCWTSCAGECYMGITGHYITRNFDFRSVLLRCFSFNSDETVSNLATEIRNVITEWNLQNKVNFAVSDNASNIANGTEEVLKWKHYGCYGHKLNLIVQQSIQKLQPTLEKIRKVVFYFERSPENNEKLLKHLQSSVNGDVKSLIRDKASSWNSTFYMVCRFVELEEALKVAVESLDEDLPIITKEEWQTCKELCEILSPFQEMTDLVSDQTYMTGSSVIVVTNCLHGTCEKLEKLDYSETVKNVITSLKRGIEETFKLIENNSTFALCTLLDPMYKYHVFQDDVALGNAKTNLESLLAEMIEKDTETKNDQSEDHSKPVALATSSPAVQQGNISAWSVLNDMIDKRKQTGALPKAMKEIDSYFKCDILSRLNENGEQNSSLMWWKEQEHAYPNLAKLFRKKCNIVATSVPCERLFSKTGNLVYDRRKRLTSKDNLEMIMFLNDNSVK